MFKACSYSRIAIKALVFSGGKIAEAKISRSRLVFNKTLFNKKLILIFLLVFSVLFLPLAVGCPKKEEPKKPAAKKKVPKTKGHVLSKKQQEEILRDVRGDLGILAQVREDPAPLKDALGKEALQDFTSLVTKEAAEGKVKVRKFGSLKLKLGDYSGGIAGVSFSYRDQSYYEDTKGNRLTKSTGAQTKYILAAQKLDGKWKIVAFYTPEAKKTPQEPGEKRD